MQPEIRKNVPLAPFTTFKVGGEAKYMLEAPTKEDLVYALDWAREKGETYHILGGGSNVLVNDNGVDGLVIRISNRSIILKGERLVCDAGAELSKAVVTAVGHGLSGMEWAAGIPGTVGGAVRGNAGAFGGRMSDAVETVEAYDLKKGEFAVYSRKECRFDYRYSVFKIKPDLIVWQVTLKLSAGSSESISLEVAEHVAWRNEKQPKLPSAGSVFKNFLLADLKKENPELAARAEAEGKVKGGFVPAAWIIEQMGLKGRTIGGAKISLEHGNFIVNTGKAQAEDIIMLISYVKQQIRDHYGVQMQEEIQYFGY